MKKKQKEIEKLRVKYIEGNYDNEDW